MYRLFEPDETPSSSTVAGPAASLPTDAQFTTQIPAPPPMPVVAYAILALNVIVFLAMIAGGVNPMQPTVDSLARWGANFGPSTITAKEWWRLFTSMFLHIGIIHIAFNMYVLIQIGPFVERLLGHIAFSIVYLVSGLVGALVSLAWNPYVVSAGASGAIFGLYGALLGFLLIRRRWISPDVLSALTKSALIFVAFNAIYGALRAGTDLADHAGGLAAGFVCGVGLSIPTAARQIQPRWVHIAAVALGAALLIGGTAAVLPRPVDLRLELQKFAAVETKTLAAYNAILNRARTEKLRDEQFADLVQKDVLPNWTAEHDSLAKLKGLPEKQKRVVSLLLKYMEARQEAWSVLIGGLRAHNLNAIKQAFAKQHEAESLAGQMSTALR